MPRPAHVVVDAHPTLAGWHRWEVWVTRENGTKFLYASGSMRGAGQALTAANWVRAEWDEGETATLIDEREYVVG